LIVPVAAVADTVAVSAAPFNANASADDDPLKVCVAVNVPALVKRGTTAVSMATLPVDVIAEKDIPVPAATDVTVPDAAAPKLRLPDPSVFKTWFAVPSVAGKVNVALLAVSAL
jgi:homogentisate 1,2-dioxygenase